MIASLTELFCEIDDFWQGYEHIWHCYGTCTGLSFVDSTVLTVCHNRHISQHRVFDGVAQRGGTSVDWFFGF
jgi:hypothetical protein